MIVGRSSDTAVLATLTSTFGYSCFRPLQEDIVRAILNGRDVFVLMPTGGGKSLCYQLPALVRDGMTVVVSPLIALMKDQVDALRALGVAATFINSSLEADEISRRQAAVVRGEVKLLYVAPERLMMPAFLRLLASAPLTHFTIDEAHCISEWGHDFRPEYRDLKRLREIFPAIPLGAFTATATRRVQADITSQLGLETAATFQGSFNRTNLFYDVRPKKDAYDQLTSYLRSHLAASGIIYCQSRAGTESLASRLCSDGFQATAYHAGLDSTVRRDRQDAFIKDNIRIIVATVAFGMGIDKPDVRFVVHYDLPKTLENFYQESGRAGRDGEPSDCILFYSYGDTVKLQRFIDEKPSPQEQEIAQWQLRQITEWASGLSCRRQTLLAYFDEPYEGRSVECCDICRNPRDEIDYTIPAQMLLSCIKRTGERFGASYIIQILRGSRDQRILNLGHERLSTYGIGVDRTEDEWRHIAREMLRGGYLNQAAEKYSGLTVTSLGHDVLFQAKRVLLPAPQNVERVRNHAEEHPNSALFEQLRALRKRLADERGIPPYVIFHDTTLKEMAARLPTTRTQLLGIPGIGERKAVDFGETFLADIRVYIAATGAQPAPSVPSPATPRAGRSAEPGESARTTLQMFKDTPDIAQIARTRNLSQVTIEGHLAEALESGEDIDIDRLVTPQKQCLIEAAIAVVGAERLKPIMEYLGEGYTYTELRFVRAALSKRHP